MKTSPPISGKIRVCHLHAGAVTYSFSRDIRDDDLRRVVARRTRHAAAGVRARATQIEPGDRHVVVGVFQHGAGGKELVERWKMSPLGRPKMRSRSSGERLCRAITLALKPGA